MFNVFFLTFIILTQWMCIDKSPTSEESGLKFEISFSSTAHQNPITGRVYVIISKDRQREPIQQITPKFTDLLIWGKDISQLKPGEAAVIDGDVLGFPLKSLNNIPPGDYYLQGFINIYTEFKRSDGHTLWLHNVQNQFQRYSYAQYYALGKRRDLKMSLKEHEEILKALKPKNKRWLKTLLAKRWGHFLRPSRFEEGLKEYLNVD